MSNGFECTTRDEINHGRLWIPTGFGVIQHPLSVFADFRASSGEFWNWDLWDSEFTPSGDALYVCVGVRHYISRVDTKTRTITQVTESPPDDRTTFRRFGLQFPSAITIDQNPDPVSQQYRMFVATSDNGIRRLDLSTGLHSEIDATLSFAAGGIDMLSDGVLIAPDAITGCEYAIRPKERAFLYGVNRFVTTVNLTTYSIHSRKN